MRLTLGFSPCPNDCFMFDAIVNRRIDLEGLEFSIRMADVEALNKAAFAGEAIPNRTRAVAASPVIPDMSVLRKLTLLGVWRSWRLRI